MPDLKFLGNEYFLRKSYPSSIYIVFHFSKTLSSPGSDAALPVCEECIPSLKVKRKTPKPPKFSIAIGFWPGQLLPHLRACSRVDIKCCTAAFLARDTGYVKFYDQTNQHQLKGHVIVRG